jgi:hypothetical protein
VLLVGACMVETHLSARLRQQRAGVRRKRGEAVLVLPGARATVPARKAVSNHGSRCLYPSFTEFSTRFSSLYLISLQQRSINLVLYTLNPILETYFVPNFCTYVFIISQIL